jgi:Zn-dependent protease with chaperone function
MATNTPPLNIRKQQWKTWLKCLMVPVLVLAFFAVAPYWLNARLRSSVLEAINQNSSLTTAEKTERTEHFSHVDFQQVCLDCPPGSEQLHDRLVNNGVARNFQLLHWALGLSLLLCALLLATTGIIVLLNRQAQQSQAHLIRYYRWGWHLSIGTALVKVLFLIPLLTYGTFEFTVLLSDKYYPQLIFLIVVGGLLGLCLSLKILFKKVPLEFAEPMAREVTPTEAPMLWQAVRTAAERLQTSPPDSILVGLQLNFYVTELAVKYDGGKTRGKTLYFSYPLLKQLSVEEVTAIIGHELGHFIGADTMLTREFYPLRRKAQGTVVSLMQATLAGWSSRQLLEFFGWCFSETEQTASRARELLADQKAATLTSPEIAARALVRFQIASEAFQRTLKDSIKDKTINPFEVSLATCIQEKLLPETTFWTQLFEQKLPHPLDSHPTLQIRLDALGQSFTAEQAKAVAITSTGNAYEQWFGNQPTLFTSLNQQAEAAVEKMRSRNIVAEADYQTEAGRQILEQHFPEKKWPGKNSPWVLIIALGVLSLICLALVFYINILALRLGFIACLITLVWLGISLNQHQRRMEATLYAGGIRHTSWNRPLQFCEVSKITGLRQYANITLHFHLKTRQPSFKKFGLFKFPGKRVTLTLGYLQGNQEKMAEAIFKYFNRQIDN